MKYYLASYIAKPLIGNNIHHGQLWVSVKNKAELSIVGLRKHVSESFLADSNPKNVTIISFQKITKKQYNELENQ